MAREKSQALVARPVGLKILGAPFELYPAGLTVIGKPTKEEYSTAFQRLELIEGSIHWWYGDLALSYEGHYGAIVEIAAESPFDAGTIYQDKWVASRYEPYTRVQPLSFVHHRIAAPLDDRLEWLKRAEEKDWPVAELAKQIRLSKILPPSFDGGKPTIAKADYADWLPEQPHCDLLLTDPPYSTEIDDIHSFVSTWLPMALAKVKPTGRAYVFIGAYPKEIEAYLNIKQANMTLANVMVWVYQNTIGPSSKYDYNLNWQAILYYRGQDAPKLDCPILTEQFAVQDVNAPDGRTGIRYYKWQKPDELAERIIRHSTKPRQLVLDCFAGTGTFLLAAAKLRRYARGCDIDERILDIAIERGCRLE